MFFAVDEWCFRFLLKEEVALGKGFPEFSVGQSIELQD